MSTNLMQASRQWSTRPSDERFVSLLDMQQHFNHIRENSRAVVVESNTLNVIPDPTDDNNKGILVGREPSKAYAPTHWAFGQIAQLAEAPANYLRTLPAPMAADCINYGLHFKRSTSQVGALLYRNGGSPLVRAVTGPKYGRIWNADVVSALVKQFGNGTDGKFRVPGEFGKAVTVTKDNTTLYAGDRDMFVFLADEENRITVPNRRDGKAGSLARGFFMWNSEVGAETYGLATFLFDYVCCNRIVWGATDFKEIRIRHTSGAPDRFLNEVRPALMTYANSATANVSQAIADAQKNRIAVGKDKDARNDAVNAFLAQRFGSRTVQAIRTAFELEEQRPIETIWDAVTGVTAYAKGIEWQDARVEMERKAGELLEAA